MVALVRLEDVSKVYAQGGQTRVVLQGAQADFAAGEFVAIRGRSGSGKTTLLNLVAAIDEPTQGEVIVDQIRLGRLSPRERAMFRRQNIGFVFQFFNLIPTLTVLENVLLPAELAGDGGDGAEARALGLLRRVGLEDRKHDFPDRLSGGEQQRVAIARALIQSPRLVLADEPTGNLDSATGESVMTLLTGLTREMGKTLILATHSHRLAASADRTLTIQEGRLVPEGGEPRAL
jgi:putative ABC transport system ATP-binding protein